MVNFNKTYMTRSQSKFWASEIPVGDATGGAAYGEFNDPVTAMVGGSVITGLMGANAARGAADTQAGAARDAAAAQLQASREANALQKQMYEENVARQQPFVQAGMPSLEALKSGLAPGGQFTQTFKPSDLYTDPSYQWRLQQGTANLNASAAARGLLGSGQNLKDITDYGQGAASQEYQAAFNRYQTNQGNLYNRLAGMAQMSQNAAAGVGSQGMQVAQGMGQNLMSGAAGASNYLTSGAAANAAGQVGAANAFTGAIQGGIGNWMGMQYLDAYKNRATPTTSGFQVPNVPTPGAPIDVTSIQG